MVLPSKKKKVRLDWLVQQCASQLSRSQAARLIEEGKVLVEGKPVVKPGQQVEPTVAVTVLEQPKYVSRAGYKLEHALAQFTVDPTGYIVLDAGLSTGGFTDCLLQHGAQKIYGVDVGTAQAHEKIRADVRVVVMEQTDLRTVEELSELVDLVTLDLSFISVLKVIDYVVRLLKPEGELIVLIKPQFETEKKLSGKSGIVSTHHHQEIVDRVKKGIEAVGFTCKAVIPSPILGGEGNQEFLGYFVKIS